jgi:hypothetical protein
LHRDADEIERGEVRIIRRVLRIAHAEAGEFDRGDARLALDGARRRERFQVHLFDGFVEALGRESLLDFHHERAADAVDQAFAGLAHGVGEGVGLGCPGNLRRGRGGCLREQTGAQHCERHGVECRSHGEIIHPECVLPTAGKNRNRCAVRRDETPPT